MLFRLGLVPNEREVEVRSHGSTSCQDYFNSNVSTQNASSRAFYQQQMLHFVANSVRASQCSVCCARESLGVSKVSLNIHLRKQAAKRKTVNRYRLRRRTCSVCPQPGKIREEPVQCSLPTLRRQVYYHNWFAGTGLNKYCP